MTGEFWMIEAMIQPFKLDSVTLALEQLPEFRGMTVSECRGFGPDRLAQDETAPANESGTAPRRRRSDSDLVDFAPKVKLEIVVAGRVAADVVVSTIARVAHTGRRGDGKIFLWPVTRVVRVQTMQEGEAAL